MGTLVSSTNKTDCHDIAEILLKVALNTINLTLLNKVLWIENVLISMGYCIHSKKHEKNVFYHFILSVKIVLLLHVRLMTTYW
jgi:hypothetical protein